MNDDDLRQRFAQLRAEELGSVPRFQVKSRARHVAWRLIAATAALLLVAIITITIRSRPTKFSDTDRAAVRSVAAWHPPTDFLLRTPGSEMLTTTPRIPDLKGIPR
ncbi:MAG: hypothetical protein QOE82_899 [Thermoanaerobaculia bacterium]|jgi:hypothetical protein|nr:hypothetical protein [Thermoanaerobaculia bacterium]